MGHTVYTQHRYTAVFVGETGHHHQRATEDDGVTPFAIQCDACEPFLVKEGWVYNPALVPLTDEQLRRKERIEVEGNAALKAFQEKLAESAAVAAVAVSAPKAPATRRVPKPKPAVRVKRQRRSAASPA